MANTISRKRRTSGSTNESEALAFINLSEPADTPSGARKMGYIVLLDGNEDHIAYFEHLSKHPEDAAKFVSNLIIEFRPNKKPEPKAASDIKKMFA